MKEIFGYKDSLRNWLLGDKRRPLLEFTTRDPNMLKSVEEAFGGDRLVSPLMWYQAYVNGTQYEAEKKLPAAADVEVPLLHISGENDPLAPAALYETQEAKTAVPDLTNVELDSTHLCRLRSQWKWPRQSSSGLSQRI